MSLYERLGTPYNASLDPGVRYPWVLSFRFDRMNYYALAMTMAGVLHVTPVCPYVRPSVCHTKRRPLSKSNTFDQRFLKLGHIVKYNNVFFKFDNDSYGSMLSGLMTHCL